MGCDIHLYAEVRRDGTWHTADTWSEDGGFWHVPYEKSFYSDRNYDLFAILADVRNGRGFAGVRTGEGFVPMASPRGVPEDASPEYRRVVEQWSGDGHSHSWHTVEDVMAYDWTQTTRREGWVTMKEWAHWKLWGKPTEWCGSVDGGGTNHTTTLQVERVLESLGVTPVELWHDWRKDAARVTKALGGTPYVKVAWEIPYHEAGRDLLSSTLPRLWRLGPPADVRMVFFFDN
jgi:hypothetical protein